MNTIEKLGGRKMILAVTSLLVLSLLAAFKPEALTTEFITGILGLVGLFGASNTINSIAQLKSGKDPLVASNNQIQVKDMSYLEDELKTHIMATADLFKNHETVINNVVDAMQKIILTQQQTPTNLNKQPQDGGLKSNADANRQAAAAIFSNGNNN